MTSKHEGYEIGVLSYTERTERSTKSKIFWYTLSQKINRQPIWERWKQTP